MISAACKHTVILLVFTFSCSPNTESEKTASVPGGEPEQIAHVETVTVKKKFFNYELNSNGRIEMGAEVPLIFRSTGLIGEMYLRNSASVAKGDLIASLQNAEQKLALSEAKLLLAESWIEVNDQLVTKGGRSGDTASVAPDVYTYIKLKSGYERAKLLVQRASLELDKTYLKAPFAGSVVDLNITLASPVSPETVICKVIDPSKVLAKCPILETELKRVYIGQKAHIDIDGEPARRYTARVTDINSVVDNNGLVPITLQIEKSDAFLVSGMNVPVVLETAVANKISVPKSAVVSRGSKKVVFTYVNGRAKWHFVETGAENNKDVLIEDGIASGDQVIISGNENLAHDARVSIK